MGSLQHSPKSPAGFKGPTSKRERGGKGKGGEGNLEKNPPSSKCVRTGLEVPEQGVGGARDGVWRGARKLSSLRTLEVMSP